MAIIDRNYFINEIFVPQSQDSASGSLLATETSLDFFIAKYERECLLYVLGYKLFLSFNSELDYNEPNKLKATADQKWDDLLNGKEYVDGNGDDKVWRGIRFKNDPSLNTYNSSFIANYVYFYYERSDNDTRTNVGNVNESAKNAFLVSKTPKVVSSWNQFVEATYSECEGPRVLVNQFGLIGHDWLSGDGYEVTLNKFITDMNELDESTYEGYRPKMFRKMTEFGL